ncbi:MAG: oligosaccharide flippase family protein [Patescibacteria group bacterium]|nr:oligosaccharide flippase family protein [Patescibacteria group bacterium]
MINAIRGYIYRILKFTEKYTKTDMIYLAKGGSWLFLGNLVSLISSFVLSIILANFLDKATFGIYKYIITLFGWLGLFTLSGMGIAMIRSVAQQKEGSIYKSIKIMMTWGLLGALSSLVLSLYYFYNNNTLLGTCFLVAVFFLPFVNVFNIYSPILKGRKKFDSAVKYEIVTQIVFFVLAIIVLWLKPELPYLILPFLVTYSLFQFLLFLRFKSKTKLNDQEDSEMVKQGIRLSMVYFVSVAAASIDHLVIFYILGPVDLAIYFIALAPIQQMKGIVKIIGSLALPKLASADSSILNKIVIKKTLHFFVFLSIPIVVYVLLSPYFYNLVYPSYTDSINLSRLLALALFASAGNLPLNYFYSQNKTKAIFKWNVASLIIKTILIFIGIYLWGLLGVAIGFILAQICTFVYSIYLVKYEK